MSRPSVVVHIGLHKTATRYLQRAVFGHLDPTQFAVNPEPLFTALHRAARAPGDPDRAAAAETAAAAARDEANGRTLLISDPAISGDMYSSHVDYAANLALIQRLFPEATILYFVRRPVDWLQSAYRQSLVKGRGVSIERFLNYHDGEFHPRAGRRMHGVRTVEALTLRFREIYQEYARAFGAARVYLLRQEDLRTNAEAVSSRLAEALGLARLPPPPAQVSSNRAFSAFAIHAFFPGVWRKTPQDSGRGVGEGWSHPLKLRLRRLRTTLIKHGSDRLFYWDWDLLARHDMRAHLEAAYRDDWNALGAAAEELLRAGPSDRVLQQARAVQRDTADT